MYNTRIVKREFRFSELRLSRALFYSVFASSRFLLVPVINFDIIGALVIPIYIFGAVRTLLH